MAMKIRDAVMKLISIVVPTHNETENIAVLHERIRSVFDGIFDYDFELIFVDDSSDHTPQVIKEQIQLDSRVKLIRLTRKFGQAVAICAGLEKSSGLAAIIMDADLQDPPESIPDLIAKWENGFDVVYVKRPSESRSLLYSFGSTVFYKLLFRLSAVKIPAHVGEFRILDKRVVEILNTLTEKTRFLRGLTIWPGFKCCEVEIVRGERLAGETNYNFSRSMQVAIDGIVSFSIAPLRLAIFLGFTLMVLSLLGASYALFLRLYTDTWASGWTLMFIAITLTGAINCLLLGVIGEYIGRIFLESINRPLFVKDYEIGFPNDEE
jgi:dolichol-phosphate mannosyltransferase